MTGTYIIDQIDKGRIFREAMHNFGKRIYSPLSVWMSFIRDEEKKGQWPLAWALHRGK